MCPRVYLQGLLLLHLLSKRLVVLEASGELSLSSSMKHAGRLILLLQVLGIWLVIA